MKIVVQRVLQASVESEGEIVGAIDRGIMVLLGLSTRDAVSDLPELYPWLEKHLVQLRLWPDEERNKPWQKSVRDLDYGILLVSQFTLYGKANKGTRPDFHSALNATEALEMFNSVRDHLRSVHGEERVQTGAFGQYMNIDMRCDGPVTMIFEKTVEEEEAGEEEKEEGS